ncbi:hypothetical protein [uncultured Thiodictyon sp.]|uniref:hypothetical protein n=1 Tax=uncultured Thiodictyon sp. TaxID=1846217 RepID=UPI0025D584D5|nr:hypothetical protein [uncultured Thiodictyon sp.]
MTAITLDLPDSLVRQADQAARLMQRPLEQVLAAVLEAALPALDDIPPELQARLLEMTWLGDGPLLAIAHGTLSEPEQQRLSDLGQRSANLTPGEQAELALLRDRYGELTLRKARAYALLSIRSGKALLGQAAAA